MDTEQTPLSDADAEAANPTLSEDDWRADLIAYMGDPADERQPDEFTVADVSAMYPNLSLNTIAKRLSKLVQSGEYTKRTAVIDGHATLLYRKAR